MQNYKKSLYPPKEIMLINFKIKTNFIGIYFLYFGAATILNIVAAPAAFNNQQKTSFK
jgi:hypothetical protein